MVRLSLKDGTPIVALERVMTPILPANAASSTISAPAAFFWTGTYVSAPGIWPGKGKDLDECPGVR
jgi:hypothetical protein